jgi:hypothetical protein
MQRALGLAVFVVVLALPAVRVAAHHGTGISYNFGVPPLTIKGTVTEFAWRNPHVSIFLDVKDADGKVTNWGVELSNISTLAKEGYNRNSLKPGQDVTVVITRSRSGAPVGLVVKVILADGKEILHRDQPGERQPTGE